MVTREELIGKARLSYESGDYKATLDIANELISKNPQDYLPYYLKSIALDKQGKQQESLRCIESFIKLGPETVDCFLEKGDILLKASKTAPSIRCYDKCLKLDPNNVRAIIGKGKALCDRDNSGSSLKYFDLALKLDPKNADAIKFKQIALGKIGTQSFGHTKVLPNINPNENYLDRADKLKKEGKLEDAVICCNTAIQLNPYDFAAWYKKADLCYDAKKFKDARLAYEKCLENNYNTRYSQYGIANSYRYGSYKEESVDWYEKAMIENPDDEYALTLESYSFCDLGRLEDSIKCFDRILSFNKSNPYNFCFRARVLEENGQPERALNDYKAAADLIDAGAADCLPAGMLNYVKYAFGEREKLQKQMNDILDKIPNNPENKEESKAKEIFKGIFQKNLDIISGKRVAINEKLAGKENSNAPEVQELKKEKQDYDTKLAQMEKMLLEMKSNMEKANSKHEEELKKYAEKIDALNAKVEQAEKKVEVLSKKIDEKIEKLASELKMTKDEFAKRFDLQEKKINEIQEKTKEGFTLINEKFRDEPEIKDYALQFYYTFNDFIQAYKILNTGTVQGIPEKGILSSICGILSSAPMIGDVMGIIESAINFHGDTKFEMKIAAMTKITRDAESQLDMPISKIVALTVIRLSELKKDEIYDVLNSPPSKVNEFVGFIQEKIGQIKSMATRVKEVPLNKAQEIGIEDVAMYVDHLVHCTTEQTVKNKIINIDFFRKPRVIEKTTDQKEVETAKNSSCCVVFIMNEIKYDNLMLNKMDLLKEISKKLHCDLPKIMDASEKLAKIFDKKCLKDICESDKEFLIELMRRLLS